MPQIQTRQVQTRQVQTRRPFAYFLLLLLLGAVFLGAAAAWSQEGEPKAAEEKPASETPAPRQAWKGFPVVEVGPPPHVWRGKPIDLSLKDADLVEVLRSFAKLTDVNIVIDPRVQGKVTVELHDVPWDQALYVILKTQGLGVEVTGNVWAFQERRNMTKPRP